MEGGSPRRDARFRRKEDGSVVTWGADEGGNSDAVTSELQGGVRHVVGSSRARKTLRGGSEGRRLHRHVVRRREWRKLRRRQVRAARLSLHRGRCRACAVMLERTRPI